MPELYCRWWKNCGASCGKSNNFCVQPGDSSRQSSRITRRFSIAPIHYRLSYVGKRGIIAATTPAVFHGKYAVYFSYLTDVASILSTISTPSITTTTKNI